MKQIMVMSALLILILTFPLQYALEQKNHYQLSQFQMFVHNAKEQAKQDGYFTDATVTELKANIVSVMKDITVNEIEVTVTGVADRKVRGEQIHYRIGVPLKKINATPGFWGIDPNDNKMIYYIDNYTSSEWVAP